MADNEKEEQREGEPTRTPAQLEEFLAKARKQFEQDAADEKKLRDAFDADLKMCIGEQWDETIKQARIKSGRPALSFPRTHTFVQRVANEARQQRPEIKYVPTEDNDKDTAEVYEGIARHIQYSSRAKVAYETANFYQCAGSYGYFRMLPQYSNDENDDQEVIVEAVMDPQSVYGVLIPSCFGIPTDHAFVVSEMPRAQFEAKYPESEVVSLGWDVAKKKGEGWIGTETIRIAEYWWVETKLEPAPNSKRGRKVEKHTVHFCKINGLEIIEDSETEWPGKRVPIFAVLGMVVIEAGEPVVLSVIRFQKDAQRLLNLYKSRIAETISVAPIQPYMVPEGAIPSGQHDKWANMNNNLAPYLLYKSYDADGRQIPPPVRNTFEPPIASLTAAAQQEVDDMKATAGIFDPSLGARSNSVSGKAKQLDMQSSDMTNMHFLDNLGRAFDEAGRELAEVIPVYYDTARTVRIMGADEAPKLVKINQQTKNEKGDLTTYKIGGEGVAKYDVITTMGRSFSTKRMESYDQMAQLIQSAPNMLPMFGDMYFKNSDMAGSDEIAERFKKMLPPNLQGDDENQLPPEAQAIVGQAQQQMTLMQGELQKLMAEKQGKVIEHQGKMQQIAAQHQADMELENRKLEAQITVAEINTKAQNLAERNAFLEDMVKQLHGQAHEVAMSQIQNAHDAQMADMGAQNAAQTQQNEQQFQAQQAAEAAKQSVKQ